jgi:hypothetical protein
MAIQHRDIAEANLHEPKGISTAATGKVYVANGIGSGTWSFQSDAITLDIASLDTVADYYLVFPFAATITKIYSVIDGAILTADKVLTASIGGVAVTGGALTIAFTAAAAGDIDSCTPSAANAIGAGAALKIAATGATTGGIRGHVTIQYQRTA